VSDLDYIPDLPDLASVPPASHNLRRHLIAAALSALLPGAGQLFLGKRLKGMILLVLLVTIASGFWPLRLPRSFLGVLLITWACLPLWLFAIFDALVGRDEKSQGRLSKWWLLAVLPLCCIGGNIFFTSLLFASGFRPLRVAASSMEPTIMRDERIVADMNYYHKHQGHRGEVVIVSRQSDSSSVPTAGQDLLFVKRIIAIGGDTIEGKDQQLFLNGQIQREPFVNPLGSHLQLDRFGPVVVPSGKYFVMGDSRDISLDSRSFGPVDASSIVGKALYVYRFQGQPLSRELN
jgi:signal peptidase I